MKEIELLLPFGIFLNLFQIIQIIVFYKFSVCEDEKFTIEKFIIIYSIISLLELGIMVYILIIVHRKEEIETEKEENTILSSVGIYIFIKYILILCESFIEKTIDPFSRTKIYFHFMKFIKTFATMNSFVTVLIEKTKITERRKKIGLMIGIPLLCYGFFLGTNQLIIFFRKRNDLGYRIVGKNSNQQNNSTKKQNNSTKQKKN